MGEKANSVFTIIFLGGIILFLAVADLVKAHIDNPDNYWKTEEFIGQDKWNMIQSGAELVLQKKDINGVYLGREHRLFAMHLPSDYKPEKMDCKLDCLVSFVKEWDAKVLLVPSADNIYPELLPEFASKYDEEIIIGKVKELIGEQRMISVFDILRRHKGEDIFYKTDSGWTALGAYYAYLEWLRVTGRPPYQYDRSELESISDHFLGDLYDKAHVYYESDSVKIFPKRRLLYEQLWSQTDKVLALGTGFERNRRLFVVGDNNVEEFIPLLAPIYKSIYVMRTTDFDSSVSKVAGMYLNEGDDVLVLCNCSNLFLN